MNKKLTIVGGIVVLVFMGLAVMDLTKQSTEYGIHKPVILNPDNVAAYLSSSDLVYDLPKDSRIQINFGNLPYYITGQGVVEGTVDNPDLEVNLPESYIGLIGDVGLCDALHASKSKNDLKVNTYLSKGQLLWKYKGLLKYKNCVS